MKKNFLIPLFALILTILAWKNSSAQTFIPVNSSSNLPFSYLLKECDAGAYHYLLFIKPTPNDTIFLYRFDGTNFSPVDSFKVYPTAPQVYSMAYHNNEIYFGGQFDSINHAPARRFFRYSLTSKTITASKLSSNISAAMVTTMKHWNGKMLLGGWFNKSGVFSTVVMGQDSVWSFMDNSVFDSNSPSTRIWDIAVRDSSSFYIAGTFNKINLTTMNGIALWSNGQWSGLGTGIPDKAFYNQTELAYKYGKIFVSYFDTTTSSTVSYFDGSNWTKDLVPPANPMYHLLASGCGLFVIINDIILNNGVALFDQNLQPGSVSGASVYNMMNVFEHKGKVYVFGLFSTNSVMYKLANVACSGENIIEYDRNDIAVFPNPAIDIATVHTDFMKHAVVSLYNCSGELVRQLTDITGESLTIERGTLPPGLYMIKITDRSRSIVSKILLQD